MLDEFDKIAKKMEDLLELRGDGRRDVSGEGVQQSLLKLVEGTKVQLNPPSTGQSGFGSTKSEPIIIDTSNILFIFMGAFTGLERHVVARLEQQHKNKWKHTRNINSNMSNYKTNKRLLAILINTIRRLNMGLIRYSKTLKAKQTNYT